MPGQGIPCSFQEMLLHISGPSGINHLGITSFPSKQTRKLSREEPREIFGIRTINSEIYPEPPFSHLEEGYREGTQTTSFPENK